MEKPLLPAEDALQRALHNATTRLRSAMRLCPPLDKLDDTGVTCARIVLEEANAAYLDTATITSTMENLSDASQEIMLLATSSRMAINLIREALTLLSAELDTYGAA